MACHNRLSSAWAEALAAVAALASAAHAAPPPPAYVLVLEGAVEGDRPLRLYLDAGGPAVAAFAAAPAFNKAPHDVDASALKVESGQIVGQVRVTINPDAYVPKDGKPVACVYRLQAATKDGSVAGTYAGAFGALARSGTVGGTVLAPADPSQPVRVRLRLPQALRRLAPREGVGRGPNVDYALDVAFAFTLAGGEARDARFETVVPDYRRYSAIVDRVDVTRRGSALEAAAAVTVDYGDDPGPRFGPDAKRVEQYVYTFRGLAIGDAAAGTFDARVGALRDRGLRFTGTLDASPPPEPDRSLAFLRLHGGMRGGAPVLVYLSLLDGRRIHGFAYAPGYNHQPQPVDASGLVRDGAVLKGPAKVSIRPDCYRPPEYFDVNIAIDARAERGVVAGTFVSTDAGQEFRGPITGDLRGKAPAAATMETLAACDLDFGYALPSGPMPKKDWRGARPNNLVLRMEFADGKLARAEALNPHDRATFRADMGAADLRLEGDRLTGRAVFTLRDSPVVETGRYEFSFEGIADGDKVSGFWCGSRDGKPILTKSAKLSGTLAAR